MVSACYFSRRQEPELTTVYRIDRGEENEQCPQLESLVHAVQAQTHVEQDCGSILPTIRQVWEGIPCISVASDALERTPDTGQGREETE